MPNKKISELASSLCFKKAYTTWASGASGSLEDLDETLELVKEEDTWELDYEEEGEIFFITDGTGYELRASVKGDKIKIFDPDDDILVEN
jgi:hypothetical protein